MENAKEIRKVVREGLLKGYDKKDKYIIARCSKQVLLFDPEYGIYGDYMDFATFNTALQAMANACKMNFWEAAKSVKAVREIAVDQDYFQFHMPSTKAAIEALK